MTISIKQSFWTPPIRGPNGQAFPDSIASARYLKINGVPQYVLIRGAYKTANPALIMLHGGPGFSETQFWRYHNSRALEQHYTVVYWDQRGAGKSHHNGQVDSKTMNVQQFVNDLHELVLIVCRELQKDKVVLFGHSWGSVLGPLYMAQHPEKILAYIGCAQIGDWTRSEQLTYQYTIDQARQRGYHRMLQKLQTEVGPPPHDAKALSDQRLCLAELDGDTSLSGLCTTIASYWRTPETSLMDLARFFQVLDFSISLMWTEVVQINVAEHLRASPKFSESNIPTFFLLGRLDHCVDPYKVSLPCIDSIRKADGDLHEEKASLTNRENLYWFEHSKHLPFVDEPEKFNHIMTSAIRQKL